MVAVGVDGSYKITHVPKKVINVWFQGKLKKKIIKRRKKLKIHNANH